MMNDLKIPFFKKVIMAIKDFDKYLEFAASSFLDTFLYALKLAAIFTLFLSMLSIYSVSQDVKSIYDYIDTQISFIDYENGLLQIENKNNEPIIVQNNLIDKLIIDTTVDKEKKDEYLSQVQKASSGIVFLNDKIILKPIDSNSMVISYSYSEIFEKYNIDKIDKQTVLDYISGSNILKIYGMVFIASYISQYIICIINIILYSFLIGSLGYFTAILLRLRIKFVALCKMVVYSLTLPIILNVIYAFINVFTGFEIVYFDIIYIAITYIYIVAAILLIKSDVIKRGQELQEIIKEQERIRQELERKKEEEKRQEEEQKRKEEEKKRQEKEKKKEEKQTDNEPQGDNA